MKGQKYRFAPKVYGRGIVPISREGRLITFLIVALIVGGALLILGPEEDPERHRVVFFFVFILVMSLVPIFLIKHRTKGKLKWRWGVKDVDWE